MQKMRVPPGEKEAVGEGSLVLSSALWGSQMCPLAAGQGRPQETKNSTTDWGWARGGGSNVIVPKAPPERGACPVNTQQDLMCWEGRQSGKAAEPAGPRAPAQTLRSCTPDGPRVCYSTVWSCLPPKT